jgi:hypothetical protein
MENVKSDYRITLSAQILEENKDILAGQEGYMEGR